MSDDTLTLRASGPAEATLRDETDGVTIATTTETDLDAELEIDADWLTEHGYVSKRSEASLYADDVANVICETRSGDDGTFEALDGWTLELHGSFEAWAGVAYEIADEKVSVGSRDKTANAMCLVLHGLAEHAVGDRPQLVMLDILGSYDPSDYTREAVLAELAEADGDLPTTTPTAEAAADD
jgi:hypothetical protein